MLFAKLNSLALCLSLDKNPWQIFTLNLLVPKIAA